MKKLILDPQCRHKSQLAVAELDFGVFRLSSTRIQTSLDLLKSIRDFPRPRNLTDLRSWFDLVNQLGNFFKEIMAPFRPLLTKDAVFQLLPEHGHAFVEVKYRLSTASILTYHGVNLQTILATDKSRGIGLCSPSVGRWCVETCTSWFKFLDFLQKAVMP